MDARTPPAARVKRGRKALERLAALFDNQCRSAEHESSCGSCIYAQSAQDTSHGCLHTASCSLLERVDKLPVNRILPGHRFSPRELDGILHWCLHGQESLSNRACNLLEQSGKVHAVAICRAMTQHWMLSQVVGEAPSVTTYLLPPSSFSSLPR